MGLRSLVRLAVVLLAVLGFAAAGEASLITYRVSGIASGTIGGSAFTNALVQYTVTGDTANVITYPGMPYVSNPSSLTTVTIAGIGTATITDLTDVVSFFQPIQIDPGLPVLPYFVIFTEPDGTGLAGIGSNALLGYDLRTSFGPITASPGGISRHAGIPVNTTLGQLLVTAEFTPTTLGTFSATVPEPMSLLLLGSGIAVLAGRSRNRARMRG